MSIATMIRSVARGMKVAVKFVAHRFVALFGDDVAKQFVHDSYVLLQSAIGKIVLQVVEQLKDTTLDSQSKRETAVSRVLLAARDQAIAVAESEARLLIELAVQFVKGNFQLQALN